LTARDDGEDDRVATIISSPAKLPNFLIPGSQHTIPAFALYNSVWNASRNQVYFSRALAAGYRHIETNMHDEQAVVIAHVLKSARIPRSRVFITSIIRFAKISVAETVNEIAKLAVGIDQSMPIIDLVLADPIPEPDRRFNLWRALELAATTEYVRHIGVCNYGIEQLEELKSYAKIWPPAVNQLEVRLLPPASSKLQSHI
jgi:diketogulonate reductase-like aldo/keto reductase